jgi:hypothetical protein
MFYYGTLILTYFLCFILNLFCIPKYGYKSVNKGNKGLFFKNLKK